MLFTIWNIFFLVCTFICVFIGDKYCIPENSRQFLFCRRNGVLGDIMPSFHHSVAVLPSAGAYVTDLGYRKNFVLILGHHYRCVLTIDRKWKIDVAIFSLEP